MIGNGTNTPILVAPGTSGNVLTSNGTAWASAAAGGGGTPGGSNTQVQFNDSSSFGGDAGLTYDKTTDELTGGGRMFVNMATNPAFSLKVGGTIKSYFAIDTAGGGFVPGSAAGDTVLYATTGQAIWMAPNNGAFAAARFHGTGSVINGDITSTSNSNKTRFANDVQINQASDPALRILVGGTQKTVLVADSGSAFVTGSSAGDTVLFAAASQNIWLGPNAGGANRVKINTAGQVSTETIGATFAIKSGSNAKAGTVTLSSGAGTISSTAITANSILIIGLKTASGVITEHPYATAVTAGTSYTITAGAGDNSTYNWALIEVN